MKVITVHVPETFCDSSQKVLASPNGKVVGCGQKMIEQAEQAYQPLSLLDAQNDGVDFAHSNDDEHGIKDELSQQGPIMVPIEIGMDVDGDDTILRSPLFSWKDPWLPSALSSLCFVAPVLIVSMVVVHNVTGRVWATFPFVLHLFSTLSVARLFICMKEQDQNNGRIRWCCSPRLASSSMCLIDICLFGRIYQGVWHIAIYEMMTEPDNTPVIEYKRQRAALLFCRSMGYIIVIVRALLGLISVSSRLSSRFKLVGTLTARLAGSIPRIKSTQCFVDHATKRSIQARLHLIVLSLLPFVVIVTIWATYSTGLHWISWPTPVTDHPGCNPLDDTECWYPFPSFHFMKKDESTVTGWRLDLDPSLLPPIKGGVFIHPEFMNEFDGFSTMGPILFYIEGLKEAHEGGVGQLQGPNNLPYSVTNSSITLLVDVETAILVAHSAEIDYLDPINPSVIISPAQPLRHNAHYALAVVNAIDINGNRLSQTTGMKALFGVVKGEEIENNPVRARYIETVIPQLQRAAPWLDLGQDPDALQLLFDYHTVSAEAQLGPLRAARDGTIAQIDSNSWDWSKHSRSIRQKNYNCHAEGTQLARTIDAEIDVPWFLSDFGVGSREATLDNDAIRSKTARRLGSAKFVVHIPCSLRAAALQKPHLKSLQAILEYGHRIFYSRLEASDYYLQEIANNNGYIIVAMDWRGMSRYDMFVIIKTLLTTPSLFRAIRDNLIQGYCNKYAMHHFIRNEMMLSDWLKFEEKGVWHDIPLNSTTTRHIFYGNSQGGILGAGYSAASGTTKLIDRSILGVPGTPFSMVLSRSNEFKTYDFLLTKNFYNNRSVRFLVAFIQIAWDSVEGSGLLAVPVTETFPRMLLQAGLGDATVPSSAAEALARGLGASILEHNPRKIYGLPTSAPANATWDGPWVTLSEIMFDEEYANLPVDNTFGLQNDVHNCLRRDPAMVKQQIEFINSGRIIDPCGDEKCHRQKAWCWG